MEFPGDSFAARLTAATRALGATGAAVLLLGAAPAAQGVAGTPLVVNASSHVVVMEYEAWFGPKAVTFPPPLLSPRPLLTSADMIPVGGGYDSEDPNVIQHHVDALTLMGADAAIVELTNNVSCIFDDGEAAVDPAQLNPCGQTTAAGNRSFKKYNQQIRDNDANIYAAWSQLGTPLKTIPLLACQDNGCLTPYSANGPVEGFGIDPCPPIAGIPVGNIHGNPAVTGTTSFEKEMAFYGRLMARHPGLNVIYEGKPLVLVFAPPGIDDTRCIMGKLHRLIVSTGLAAKYTFRLVGGYFDTDRTFWNEPPGYVPTGPVPLVRGFGSYWWSWVDRLNPAFAYYPSYTVAPRYPRVENVTVSLATAGQYGWGTWPAACIAAPPIDPPLTTCQPGTDYYVDDSLRDQGGVPYSTFANFMNVANQLQPIFLIVHQFNEFALGDEGWDANTTDDIEPADDGIGYGALTAVQQQIARYRKEQSR